MVPTDDVPRRLHDTAFFRPARIWLPERRIMLRKFSHGLRAVRIARLGFAAFLIVAVGAQLEAKGVTKSSKTSWPSAELIFSTESAPESTEEDTFLVQTWIPDFDDDEPLFTCLPVFTPDLSETKSSNPARFRKLADDDGCGVMLRMLPWNFLSIRVGSDEFVLPII